MTTLIIREDSLEARKFIEFAKTLPFVEEKQEKKLSKWDEAITEGAVTADAFFDELNARIEKWPDNA